jgi:hypothetical protein
MALTLRCPKCSTNTKKYWFSNKIQLHNSVGELALQPGGEVAWGFATRRCPSCTWIGDWFVIPTTSAQKPPTLLFDDDEDEDDDYIAHYYH